MRIQATAVIEQAQQVLGGITQMSNALWCDAGEHAFSDKDPEKRHFTETREVDGKPVTEVIDWCGVHAKTFLNASNQAPKAIQDKVG